MSSIVAIRCIEIMLGINFLFQTIEYLFSRNYLSHGGIFSWQNMKGEYSGLLLRALSFLFQQKIFTVLLVFRILVSILILWKGSLPVVILAFLLHIVVLLRFQGNFNGGSDFMTTQILMGLFFNYLLPEAYAQFGLWYMAVQLINSYFIAGIIKVRNPEWRSGKAVQAFLQGPTYSVLPQINLVSKFTPLAFLSSWIVMLWEILFPLALINMKIATVFLLFGCTFHFSIWYLFGLNRFLFSWLTIYPALIYCVKNLKL
ncbi:MAG: hypothetical protein ACXVCP_07360 [Bdellovibrio sp.]